MLKSVLDKVIPGLQMDSDSLVGFYSFGSHEGSLPASGAVLNEKLSSPATDSFDNGNLKASTFPLYNLCEDKQVVKVSGQGNFDGGTILQVGSSFPYTSWSVFIEYSSDDFTGEYNLGRTLFSTMESSSSTSGMNVGINGARKPYIEYIAGNGQKNILTLNAELGERNILSFSKSSDSEVVEISYYDPIYKNSIMQTFNTPNIEDASGVDKSYSDNLYIGDFYNTGDSNYRGFSGTVYDITIFSEFLGSGDRNTIQQSMIASDYSGERIEQELVFSNAITTIVASQTSVTGTGITGYQTVQTGTLSQRCGPDTNLFGASGVTGQLSGLTYTTTTGATQTSGYKFTRKAEQIFLDDSRKVQFKKNNLILKEALDSNDATELFIYSGLEPNINTRTTGSEFLNSYELPSDYSGQEFKFYKNGILRKSGTLSNGVIESGDYYVNDTNKVIFSDDISEDGIVPDAFYDYITGETIYLDYNPVGAAYSYTTSPYIDSDVFFNGQKLYSGRGIAYVYGGGSVTLEIDETYLPDSGEISFVPRGDYQSRTFALTGVRHNYSNGYGKEQMYLNGQRLVRDENYLIVSQNSLLNTGEFVRYNNEHSLYAGQTGNITTY